jgi:hypothetical protein
MNPLAFLERWYSSLDEMLEDSLYGFTMSKMVNAKEKTLKGIPRNIIYTNVQNLHTIIQTYIISFKEKIG